MIIVIVPMRATRFAAVPRFCGLVFMKPSYWEFLAHYIDAQK